MKREAIVWINKKYKDKYGLKHAHNIIPLSEFNRLLRRSGADYTITNPGVTVYMKDGTTVPIGLVIQS